MTKKNRNTQFDELISQSMLLNDTPSTELNRNLKARLYRQEAALKQSVPTRSISVWYLPMILNFVLFALLTVCALLLITNLYIAILVSGICSYIGLSGIAITVIGMKRSRMKADMSIRVQKRGVLA